MKNLSFNTLRLVSISIYWLIMILLCISKRWSLTWIMLGILLVIHLISMASLENLYIYIFRKFYFNYFKRSFKLIRKLYFIRYETFIKNNNELTNKISYLLDKSFATIIDTGNAYISFGIFDKRQSNKIKEIVRQTEIMLQNSFIIHDNKI